MASKKKSDKPAARRRGSAHATPAGRAAQSKAPARAKANGKQEELTAKGKPLAPADAILEECDRQLVAVREQIRAEQERAKEIIARAVTRLKKKRWPKYRTRSGFVFEHSMKDVLRRKRAPEGETKPRR